MVAAKKDKDPNKLIKKHNEMNQLQVTSIMTQPEMGACTSASWLLHAVTNSELIHGFISLRHSRKKFKLSFCFCRNKANAKHVIRRGGGLAGFE